jgi:hypothetical protein
MTNNLLGELRKQRERQTKQALADVVRLSIFRQRIYQTSVSRRSGVSRSHLRAILRAEKCPTLFIFLELSRGLSTDPFELLRAVLDRRDELRGQAQEGVQ